jgi:Na+/H+-dicarboxylate symporter
VADLADNAGPASDAVAAAFNSSALFQRFTHALGVLIRMRSRILSMPLWQQVVLALIAGVLVGLFFKQEIALGNMTLEDAGMFKFLGTLFINLIKMVVVPLVFFALIYGITNLGEGQNFSRVALKAIVTFLTTAGFAVVIGLTMGNLFQPGLGLTIDPTQFADKVPEQAHAAPEGLGGLLMGFIPTNAIGAMAEANILQVVVFAIFTGFVLNTMRDRCAQVISISHEMAHVTFKMIELIVRLSPLGVFGFISWLVGTQGFDMLKSLGMLVVCVVSACVVQYLIFGIMIMAFGRLSPMPFYRKMVETQMLAFSTSSSKATLTTAMRVLNERLGVSRSSTNFVLPLGASINMDGTAIYLGICATFTAQAFGMHLDWHHYLTLIITCTIASIGAAGIPSGSIIFMGMVLSSVGLPIETIGMIIGIDRILDMLRTTINITGDAAITLIVDATEDTIDRDVYYSE